MKFLKILYPIALIYGTISWLRNKLFDSGILKQIKFDIPIISIGNLSLGGTGKTPHIEYFITQLITTHNIAVISRGYGRKTNGFRYVKSDETAENVGDEPLQIKQKFEQICVAVGENRVNTIKKVLAENPEVNLILLDDAFQHRYVKVKFNILLTQYSNPFWKDAVVPSGRLREFRFGWRRADAIIISNCPEKIKISIPEKIKTKSIFYSKINYKAPVLISGNLSKKLILVTGIANPSALLVYLRNENYKLIDHFNFDDHHAFTPSDISKILLKCTDENMLATTEKDWMRLKPFLKTEKINLAFFPIEIEIIPDLDTSKKLLSLIK